MCGERKKNANREEYGTWYNQNSLSRVITDKKEWPDSKMFISLESQKGRKPKANKYIITALIKQERRKEQIP